MLWCGSNKKLENVDVFFRESLFDEKFLGLTRVITLKLDRPRPRIIGSATTERPLHLLGESLNVHSIVEALDDCHDLSPLAALATDLDADKLAGKSLGLNEIFGKTDHICEIFGAHFEVSPLKLPFHEVS